MAGTFVGMIEQVADRGERVDIRLDVMPEGSVTRALRSRGRILVDDVPLDAAMVTFGASRPVARRLVDGSLSEGRWIRVELADSGLPAIVHRRRVGELPEPEPVHLNPGRPLRASDREALSRTFALPTSTQDTESLLLDWLFFGDGHPYAESIVCLDVGQGSAVALMQWGRARLYFDVGAGCFANARTRPTRLKFCTCDSPIVILSHWDADHWFGAWMEPELQKSVWVCPRQTIGPFATEFARLITKHGRLLVWPDNWIRGATPPFSLLNNWGWAFRATGSGRNDSGLVLLAILEDQRIVLLPGDCGYQHIPVAGWGAVVGTHHGGLFKGPTPQPFRRYPFPPPPLLLSYGKGNTYKHPKSEARRRYEAAGWEVASTDGAGHIELVLASTGIGWTCGCMTIARRLALD